MDGKSLSGTEEKIKELKTIFPEIVTEGKIDFDKLKTILGQEVKDENERYVLSWAGKSEAYKILQQLSSATLVPDKQESVDFDNTENIFIEGENLEVLKVLQRSYFGKIKMIYIDPPYNTGKDSFIYPDKFKDTKKEYQQKAGIRDEEGNLLKEGSFNLNSKENGQYHSNWLNMMMPRLFLAKNLLREDGVIFVSIDDNEVHNLRLLMNEIFGEENFVAIFDWRKKTGANDAKNIAVITEYILCYAKNMITTQIYWNRDNDSRKENRFKYSDEFVNERGKYYLDTLDRGGLSYSDSLNYGIETPDGCIIYPNGRDKYVNDGWIWKWGKQKVKWGIENKFLLFVKSNKSSGSKYTIKYKVYEKVDNEGNPRKTVGRAFSNLILGPINQQGASDITDIFNGMNPFSNPKPIRLIQYLLRTLKNNDCIILDFFAGSGTTGHAVMQLNNEDEGKRKFILVQLPEKCKEDSTAKKNGYDTIADICKERLRRAGKKIKRDLTAQTTDTGFKVFKLQESNFKQWRQVDNEEDLIKQLEAFADNIKDDKTEKENIVFEVLLKKGYNLNSKIEKQGNLYIITDPSDNKQMLLLLEGKIDKEIAEQIVESGVKDIVVLDKLFEDNDCLKQNMFLRMKDNNINFETI